MTEISWDKYDKDVRKLASLVTKNEFRIITGIPRGGLIIAVHLSHLLNLPYKPLEEINILTPDILITDDVSDSGQTLWEYNIQSKQTATLYRKDGTRFEPRYSVETINDWISYPWER